jgi:hypothetical protein
MAKQYKVTAPYITVLVTSGDGLPRMAGFYKDHVLPPEVPDRQIKAHLESGLIEEMESSAVVEDPPAPDLAERKAVAETANDQLLQAARERDAKTITKPSTSDPKAAWVNYAVTTTAGTPGAISETQANELSKAELVERFK